MNESSATDNTSRRTPRGPERRSQLVTVAEAVFLEHGFTNSTMQLIASLAGASKETLYRHFANKETLFAEVVSRKAAQISGPESGFVGKGAPEEVLFNLGLNLVERMVERETPALLRLAIAEMSRNPGLGAILYENGPRTTQNRLAAYLRDATGRGELRCEDSELAAKLFLGAVTANYRIKSLLNPAKRKPGDAELRRHVKAAVAMFISCFGTQK